MKSRKQQNLIVASLLIAVSAVFPGCSAYSKVEFDPALPHHGKGEFVTRHKPSMLKYLSMRMREPNPPPRDLAEVESIVARADLELIGSYAEQPRVTWIGHATTLVQYRGINFLTDPHLSQYPFTYALFVEPRFTQPGLAFEQLPPIDFVVISHNHFDSLDRDTVLRFGDSVQWFVPLGLKGWFVNQGIAAARVIELDWWRSHRFDNRVELTLTPAQHWSRRSPWDTNKTLWGGWVIEIDDFRTYFVGDSGYHDTYFRQIGERLGPFDLALIPIGAYAPRYFMSGHHVDPAQAVDIHLEVGSRRSLPIHWGTFQLSLEPLLEPMQLLQAETERRGLPPDQFRAVKIGQTLILD